MFKIIFDFHGQSVDMPQRYPTRDDANWAVAKWRQKHDCRGEGFFQVVEIPTSDAALETERREMAARGLYPV